MVCAVEPLPFVPPTWMVRYCLCGLFRRDARESVFFEPWAVCCGSYLVESRVVLRQIGKSLLIFFFNILHKLFEAMCFIKIAIMFSPPTTDRCAEAGIAVHFADCEISVGSKEQVDAGEVESYGTGSFGCKVESRLRSIERVGAPATGVVRKERGSGMA